MSYSLLLCTLISFSDFLTHPQSLGLSTGPICLSYGYSLSCACIAVRTLTGSLAISIHCLLAVHSSYNLPTDLTSVPHVWTSPLGRRIHGRIYFSSYRRHINAGSNKCKHVKTTNIDHRHIDKHKQTQTK